MSYRAGTIAFVLVAVVAGEDRRLPGAAEPGGAVGGGILQPLDAAGSPTGPPERVADLAAAVATREREGPRWVWASGAALYPALQRAGVRVDRCHDIELTEALLLGHAGRWGEPRSFAAAWARLTGASVPPDPLPRSAEPPGHGQGALFDSPPGPPGPGIAALTRVYADQLARIAATDHPGRFRLLVAAESAGALTAVELGAVGLPWRADVHDAVLAELLGGPSPVGGPPRRLAELAARIAAAFGVRQLHADSPMELVRAFARVGVEVPNTRSWVLRGVDHPAVPLVLEYKELYRIWTAHGWAWRDAWVRDGRFRPEYVPGGVVSGRWATRGGGALQIPKVIRRAVVADPGWTLVVADAGQLEPRVLAAVSGDTRLAAAAGAGDLYAALARDAFGGDRARAKVALLGAMYGQTGGSAAPALEVLRRNYPAAFAYVESAARSGESGGLVRSWLGRTCPPGSVGVDEEEPVSAGGEGGRSARARARGRFTRNFVIQATAAEWAATLLAMLRGELAGSDAELVFFQHDEVIVHCPTAQAAAVAAAVTRCGERASALLFGRTPVRFPLDLSAVECYADAS
ncbi:bifunctional 3'-5' exonuclease/DNA polymerase [Salinispora arenicola]|uniref:bifunctional 3'-5' exonuclease/DNA polymerase n=1 Tax=Salinispora arenicola TaxID=168697 RepID=UPI00207AA3D1|nr:bifunctional 3'-5' exonuclease/DNA polymerase [Salinispora arenicola]MCN0153734.1 bifunctional 3'-5' exonuclease/DNA polymerase [Salinispora arenicola]